MCGSVFLGDSRLLWSWVRFGSNLETRLWSWVRVRPNLASRPFFFTCWTTSPKFRRNQCRFTIRSCIRRMPKFCSACGTGLEPDAKFCSECGRPVRPPTPSTPSSSASRSSARRSVRPSISSIPTALVHELPIYDIVALFKPSRVLHRSIPFNGFFEQAPSTLRSLRLLCVPSASSPRKRRSRR